SGRLGIRRIRRHSAVAVAVNRRLTVGATRQPHDCFSNPLVPRRPLLCLHRARIYSYPDVDRRPTAHAANSFVETRNQMCAIATLVALRNSVELAGQILQTFQFSFERSQLALRIKDWKHAIE